MVRKLLKVILPISLVAAMMVGASLNVGAFTIAKTHIIDNDDAQGYSNDRYGFDTWFKGNTLYHQDARKQACTSGNYEYQYNFPQYSRYTKIYGRVSAYLYNISFTDPSACYMIMDGKSFATAVAGYINQDLASPGWNTVGTATTGVTMPDNFQCTAFVSLVPSQSGSAKYCGADAIKIELGY